MPSGGARMRSGPKPDPESLKSSRLGRAFRSLPAEGFLGKVPRFPLPQASSRERAVWKWAWSTPQACAWDVDGAWRVDMVAEWVRMKVRAEAPDAPASLSAEALRLRHQIGLTPAGLKENGWTIAAPAAATVAASPEPPAGVVPITSARDRLRADVDRA